MTSRPPLLSVLLPRDLGEQLRSRWPYLAALGAGCLVGASGVFLVQRLSRRVEIGHSSASVSLSKELTSLHSTIKDLREAIQELKEQQQHKKGLKSALRTVTFSTDKDERVYTSSALTPVSSSASTSAEFFSAISSDEEFFDLPTDPEEDGDEDVIKSSSTESDQILELFRLTDDLCEEGTDADQRRALHILREKEELLGANSEFLWRMCKLLYLCSNSTATKEEKHTLIEESMAFGSRAVGCNDLNSEAHKWYAIAVGSRGEFVGIKEKILDGFEFKKHVDRAAELSPNDHTIQHLLGRFCYEVAELSWWERKMAATLFAEPPTATMEEARNHFLEAERIKPEGWKENRTFLAKSFLKLGESEEGLEWLHKASEMPVRNQDDKHIQQEIFQLLSKLTNT